MSYRFLLLDLDETIFDFKRAEEIAVTKTFQEAGIAPTAENIALYSRINIAQWERLERGEISREECKLFRFSILFETLGVRADAAAVSEAYQRHLAVGHYYLPGAQEALQSLHQKYRLFLVSNGTADVQAGRLKSAGIAPLFERIFISEKLGAEKPSVEFFRRAFAEIPGFSREQALIVGDSLTSDMRGGNNASIATCWVNREHKPRRADIHIDYEIESLAQLEALLDSL